MLGLYYMLGLECRLEGALPLRREGVSVERFRLGVGYMATHTTLLLNPVDVFAA